MINAYPCDFPRLLGVAWGLIRIHYYAKTIDWRIAAYFTSIQMA